MRSRMSRSFKRAVLALSVLGGTVACGSGYSSVGTVPTSSPATNVTLSATSYDVGATAVLGLTIGTDGNVWFAECADANGVGAVAKITTSAQLTVYPLPDGAVVCPRWLTLGNDRAVWFTEQVRIARAGLQSQLGRIDARGNITEFTLPAGDGDPVGIAVGGDGNIWYDTRVVNGTSVMRGFSTLTHSIVGSVTLPSSVALTTLNNTLRVNPTDGALIVASGSVTRVAAGPSPTVSQPFGIPTGRTCGYTTAGRDGYLYLQCNASILAKAPQTTYRTAYIGEPGSLVLSTGITPVTFSGPMGSGSDGNLYLWGTLGTSAAPALFAMSTSGRVLSYYLDPNVNDRPTDVVLGADGAMWFTVSNSTTGTIIRVPPYQTTPYLNADRHNE